MPVVDLNPSLPARMQLGKMTSVDRVHLQYMEEFSLIAEAMFNTVEGSGSFTLAGPSMIVRGTVGEDAPDDDIPEGLEVNQSGTLVPTGELRSTVPVHLPAMDPRKSPYDGNPRKLAAGIGLILAEHVLGETARVESEVGALLKARTEVRVFGWVPMQFQLEGMQPRPRVSDDLGPPCSADCPMLSGRVDLMFRRISGGAK